MKKILCVFLILAAATPLFCGCAVRSVVYASYGNNGEYSISEDMYRYWLAYYKTRFYVIMQDYGIIKESAYTEEFWDMEIEPGQTYGDRVFSHVDSLINEMLVCASLYDEYGLGKDPDTKKTLDNTVQSFVDNDVKAAGSRSELNKQLGAVGLNVRELKKIYEYEAKSLIIEDYLYGENGKEPVTDSEREEYYQKNYNRVKYVLLDPYKKLVKDVYGYPVMDTSTGYYKTEELTGEEQAEVRRLAESIRSNAASGADFEALMAEYNQDKSMSGYEDGFFFTKDDAYDEAFLSDALSLAVGGVTLSESSYGLLIIKKYPLEPGMWKNEINAAFFSELDAEITSEKKEKKYGEYYGSVKTDGDFRATVKLSELPLLATALSSD
ncbi:MAG: peptidylprolyl isomerase [Clostridia bacterium]|nr:peptidylprolyl isomerase [Clostridia bacterium]